MSKYGLDMNAKFFTKDLRIEGRIPMEYTIADAQEAGTADILSAKDMNGKGTASYIAGSLAAQPDFARNIVVCADAAGSAGGVDEVLIAGYTANGNYEEERVHICATVKGTAGSDKCFSRITSLTPKTTTASGAVKSTKVAVGFGDHIGLPYPIESNDYLLSCTIGGVFASTMPTVNATYNSITSLGISAAENYIIRYRTKLM